MTPLPENSDLPNESDPVAPGDIPSLDALTTAKRSPKKKPVIAQTLFFTCLVCAVGAIGILIYDRNQLRSMIDSVQQEKQQLVDTANVFDERQKQLDRMRTDAFALLRNINRVDDIPDFGGNRVIAVNADYAWSFFYVPPESEYRLRVDARILSGSDKASAERFELQRDRWEVPLVPGAGYFFRVKDHLEDETFGWILSCNRSDFTPLSETVIAQDLSLSGGGYSEKKTFAIPGRYFPQSAFRGSRLPTTLSEIEILDSRFLVNLDQNGARLNVKATILCDTPPRLHWRDRTGDTKSVSWGKHGWKYLGNGTFQMEQGGDSSRDGAGGLDPAESIPQ